MELLEPMQPHRWKLSGWRTKWKPKPMITRNWTLSNLEARKLCSLSQTLSYWLRLQSIIDFSWCLLMNLYNYIGLVAPRLVCTMPVVSLHSTCFMRYLQLFCTPCAW